MSAKTHPPHSPRIHMPWAGEVFFALALRLLVESLARRFFAVTLLAFGLCFSVLFDANSSSVTQNRQIGLRPAFALYNLLGFCHGHTRKIFHGFNPVFSQGMHLNIWKASFRFKSSCDFDGMVSRREVQLGLRRFGYRRKEA